MDTKTNETRPGVVTAQLEYLRPTAARPYNYMFAPPDGAAWQNCEYQRHSLQVGDARGGGVEPSLDGAGFALLRSRSAVQDFYDNDEVVRTYYPEVAELALAASGASRAFVFDHLVRQRQPGAPQAFGRRDGARPGAAGRVHCDFTPASAQRRLALALDGEERPPRRYSIVNLWRTLRHPVLDAPLALCDARTVAPADLVASDLFYPSRRGEIFQTLHNEHHRWWYFPAMTSDETLLFKQFDSQAERFACFTPHAAFAHPHAPAGAPLRESIEIRCLLVFDY
ncbi:MULTISPECIES: CmcJ/NvfI family oxidoreductase [unclassified Janthinobacterium]|uniref:CmcJ/NvfI family oxidoreductase n=1 Tax=unclassified Janthinobacterium TaxID=2610881 RepID=UPI00034500B3|nr:MULTISPECIES: CmcJ/NvfI family oxidoreductase [unclassified Janthinobacterium]MEC5159516.1 hypothetical protein [Janthinobacterium sp. CG_S6]